MPNDTTPTNELSADAENETLGYWLGQEVTRLDLEYAALGLFNETYGDVAKAKHGVTYTIWLDNNLSAEVTLERPRGEYVEPDGTVSALPILSVDYEAPCDVDDQEALEEWGNYFEEQKESLIAAWIDQMIEALSETDDD